MWLITLMYFDERTSAYILFYRLISTKLNKKGRITDLLCLPIKISDDDQ